MFGNDQFGITGSRQTRSKDYAAQSTEMRDVAVGECRCPHIVLHGCFEVRRLKNMVTTKRGRRDETRE